MAFEIEVAAPSAGDRPRPDGSDIRKMTAAEIQPVARALAQAFYDDPRFRWFVRDDAKRPPEFRGA